MPYSVSLFLYCIFLSFIFNFSDPVHTQSLPAFACTPRSTSINLPFCNQRLPLHRRVDDLVMNLTLSEKIQWLGSGSTSIDRLGIPKYEWWSEALHGVSSTGPGVIFTNTIPAATSFPQVILTAASFNTSLFEAIGKAVSTEARAMYNAGLAGLTFWSPNLNIFRDPRWGRGQETPGEDPFFSSKYGSTYVSALQQQSAAGQLKIAACCKHYTAYDLDNWNGVDRYHFDAQVTQQDLEDTFQPPFKSCVVDGNAASVMCSYNKVNGKPTCADPDLLAGIVRDKWNLTGYIVSDCDSVEIFYKSQRYTNTPEEAAAKALLAGLDLNCGSFLRKYAEGAVRNGLVNESAINRAVSNNFATLMRLGFFDGDPSKQLYGKLGLKDVCSEENQELAREAARQGIVLLKNTATSLPLSPTAIKSLAVIGPNANASKTMIGNYAGIPCRYTTPLQGLAGWVATNYHPGCSSVPCREVQAGDAARLAGSADATVLVMGTDQSIEAESIDRTDIKLPGQQQLLVTTVANASKGPVILVLMCGGGVDISFAKNNTNITSILWVGFPGQAGGSAIADVIFGKYNPSGKLPITWYPQSYLAKVPMTNMNMRADPATGYPGRTYRFYSGETVYDFGHGMSYSKIKHTLIRAPQLVSIPLEKNHPCRMSPCSYIDAGELQNQPNIVAHVHLRVNNSGEMSGSHTVFLFAIPPSSSRYQHDLPNKMLLGFEKVWLAQNAEAVVKFRINVCKDLSLVDKLGNTKLFSGLHTLHVGTIQHIFKLTI